MIRPRIDADGHGINVWRFATIGDLPKLESSSVTGRKERCQVTDKHSQHLGNPNRCPLEWGVGTAGSLIAQQIWG
jgi:hypothetical protein